MLTLNVNPQEFATIMRGLGALPLAEAMQTFLSLSQQAEKQRMPAPPKMPSEPPEGQ